MEVLSEAREKGIIRAHGVSCHTFGALKTAAATDWVQVDLARVNPAGVVMDSNPAAVTGVLREMKAKGKAVIGMKILGAGQLVKQADACFQWALAQDWPGLLHARDAGVPKNSNARSSKSRRRGVRG